MKEVVRVARERFLAGRIWVRNRRHRKRDVATRRRFARILVTDTPTQIRTTDPMILSARLDFGQSRMRDLRNDFADVTS